MIFKFRSGKAKYGTTVPYKRIHINEDGTFTDTLTGKNYNTSATNGEDVVITGKANHWKEAGKKDTSSYFDPMGAVNFITAAGTPILNANLSNIVGSIRDSKNASDFLKHYMMQDTGGFVNTEWAKEYPYLSLGINTIGDIGLGYGLGKTGVGLYRLRPSNLRKHIFENISPIGYNKPISRIKEAFKSALSGAEADIDNPSWFNDKSAQDLNTYNIGITKNMFGPHALEARFDAWRKYLGLPQKFNTWTKSPIVKGAYTDKKGISNLKVLPKNQSVDFINSAGGNVANTIEEFATRGYNGQKYGVSHIRDTWDLQPWSRLNGNIIEDKVIRPLYNNTIGKVNRKLSSSLNKFINKYGYDNEAIQKYLNEGGEEALDNLSEVIEDFADTESIKGKLAHKLSVLSDVLTDKSYYIINEDSKLSKLTNKLSNKIKNFEASSLLPGAKPFKIAYDIPWTNKVFPNNEMVKGFDMTNTLPTEAYRYKLKNPLLDYTYRLGGRCKLKNGGSANKPRFRRVKNYGVTDTTPYPNDEDKPNISTTRLNPFEYLAKFASRNLMELGRSGLLDTEGLNVAQDSYLVPTKAIQAKMFADAGYARDYNAEKNKDYGLVKKGVGNRNIPIYSRTNPNFGKQRKDLVVLGNSYNMDNVDKPLVHAGSYPSAIYSDNEGNIYINSWDLNDYGADAAGNTGDLNAHYNSFRKKLAKTVDIIGNPTVVTTGYQRALDNNKPIKISNYNDYYDLTQNGYTEAIKESLDNWMEKQGVELNEVGYGSPLVEIVGKRKYSLGGRCKLRNGGLTSKDRGSSKHPYPSISSKDFAGSRLVPLSKRDNFNINDIRY